MLVDRQSFCRQELLSVRHCCNLQLVGTHSAWRSYANCYACAGAVNHNLQAMKQRVNATLATFESVTRALEATASQLKKEQAHAVGCSSLPCLCKSLAFPSRTSCLQTL